MTESLPDQQPQPERPTILHVCKREMLRPLRDQILRVSGYDVDSTLNAVEALAMFSARAYDLVLVDVKGEHGIPRRSTCVPR